MDYGHAELVFTFSRIIKTKKTNENYSKLLYVICGTVHLLIIIPTFILYRQQKKMLY